MSPHQLAQESLLQTSMSYARILVNGDGLLETWATLAPDQPRHSPEAREELINRLTQFYDASGTPMTVVFDDFDPFEEDDVRYPGVAPPEVHVLFTQKRKRPEHTIERLLRQFRSLGEILVVASNQPLADATQPSTLYQDFINEIEETLRDLERKLNELHKKESAEFKTHL